MKKLIKSGDYIEVLSAREIFHTLDNNGTLDGLPFMPEMIKYCGKRFRVKKNVIQAVIDSAGITDYNESYVRGFKNGDVVILEDLRCSGESHDGCKKGCSIFWKTAWLKKVNPEEIRQSTLNEEHKIFNLQLRVLTDNDKYFCQSTQFRNATFPLSYNQRIKNLFLGIKLGNYNLMKLIKNLSTWSFWKFRRKIFGDYPRGHGKTTPDIKLDLKPGEVVDVKSLAEIMDTLDEKGRNKGLHFCSEMLKYCGKKFKVKARTDKLISEGTGKMQEIPRTVTLENVFTDSAHYAFGGCPRSEFLYWREIWLKRPSEDSSVKIIHPINSV